MNSLADRAHTGTIAYAERLVEDDTPTIALTLAPPAAASLLSEVLYALKRDAGMASLIAASNVKGPARHELLLLLARRLEKASTQPLQILLHPDAAADLSQQLYDAVDSIGHCDCGRMSDVIGQRGCSACDWTQRPRIGA